METFLLLLFKTDKIQTKSWYENTVYKNLYE